MMTVDATSVATKRDGVLIVGGYGSVGQHIAHLLADELGQRLLIGGRNTKRAIRLANTLGARARALDINDSASHAAALQDVGMVIMCLDTMALTFPHACVARAIDYISISASYEVIERLRLMEELERAHGATVVCSVGLAPGLTNLLAKACVHAAQQPVTGVDIHLLFGLGDRHGRAALEWMVDRLHRSFEITTADGERSVRAFDEQSLAEFPPPFGERVTYRFDFSDQHTLPATLGVPRVNTWTSFESPRLGRWLSHLARVGVLRWSRFRLLRSWFVGLFRMVRLGSERFAISVYAVSADRGIRTTATGFGEARATAVVAAETARRMLADPPKVGVFQLDELYELADFLPTLAANGIEVSVECPGGDPFCVTRTMQERHTHDRAHG